VHADPPALKPDFSDRADYLADHLHKCFPQLDQRILDLAAPSNPGCERTLLATSKAFRPTLLVFSWAPTFRSMRLWMGRGQPAARTPLEVFLRRQSTAPPTWRSGCLRLMAAFYGELWRNLRLVRRLSSPGPPFNPSTGGAPVGEAVSVFYENSWAKSFAQKAPWSPWRRGRSCWRIDPPIAGRLSVVSLLARRLGWAHPRTTCSLVKERLRLLLPIASIWPQLTW